MHYIPLNTVGEKELLSVCEVDNFSDLISIIPSKFKVNSSLGIGPPLSEMDIERALEALSDENIDDYLKIEKFWKPAHRERIKDERMKGWLLFKVINKNNGAYNFITLNVYSDKNMASSGGATKADWENAHGAAVINDQGDSMMALTRKVNNIVRRDHCQNFDLDLYSLTKYRRANFMKVLNGTRTLEYCRRN